jgi:tetraacyldisaccharide 4'-kinase
MIDSTLQRIWYGRSAAGLLLLPLSWLFIAVASVRRLFYRAGIFESVRVAKPVIVVGNITAGGTGKTPLVIWIANALAERGRRPAIVTRGYQGNSKHWPRDVTAESLASEVGDEAVLLARSTRAMIVAGRDRVAAALRAIERGAEIIITDDGLQHYRLARAMEIAVVDAVRLFGNGFRIPAGPLRESVGRLKSVDVIVYNCRTQDAPANAFEGRPLELSMRSVVESAWSPTTKESRALKAFSGKRVHAIAGIGNPQGFFDFLKALQILVEEHPLPDHASIAPTDLRFDDDAPVLMTEKDAVKCEKFIDARCWVVPLVTSVENSALLLKEIDAHLGGPNDVA